MQRFEKEMRTALAEQEQAFSHLSDSLKIRNSILNRNLSRLIREIGQDETERMEERHMRVAELRETAFDAAYRRQVSCVRCCCMQ